MHQIVSNIKQKTYNNACLKFLLADFDMMHCIYITLIIVIFVIVSS